MSVFDNEAVCISEIKICCKVSNEKGVTIHKNRPYHGLVLYLHGSSSFCFDDGEDYAVSAGQIIYLPKYSNYTSLDSDDAVCIAVNFDFISEEKTYDSVLLNVKYGEKYFSKFEKILNVWEEKACGYQNCCLSILYDIIFNMQQDTKRDYVSSLQKQMVEKAQQYINANIKDETMSVARVAQEIRITPEYLRKLFKAFINVSPVEYIRIKKMELAKTFLESGEIKLSHIPYECGFTDYTYFSKIFKKHFGISPKAYLMQMQREREK